MVLLSRDEAGLNSYLSGPHQALSSKEYSARFGPSQEAINAVKQWAQSHGLSAQVADGSPVVRVSGSDLQLSQAFSTSMHRFQAGKSSYVAANGAAQLPANVAAVTASVVGLSAPKTLQIQSLHPKAGTQSGASYGPGDLTNFYQAPSTATGKGQAVSIIGAGDLTQVGKDLVTFEDKYGLPHVPLNVIKVDGGSSDTSNQDEWDLDTQYSSGFAPDVSGINFYDGAGLDDQSLLDSTAQWVDDDSTKQGSASLGECESDAASSGFLASEDELLKKAAAQGQTLFVSSGDTGSKCGLENGVVAGPEGVSYPASSPYAVSVGGTTINDIGQHQESGWNASGGGQSSLEPGADWQKNVGGAYSAASRGVPDVALDADPASGYSVIVNGSPTTIGGTSASAPSWNGIWARAEQQNGGNLGFGAPLLYQVPASAFNDITSGNNGDYSAGPGWDYVTGRGTPNISAIVSQVGSAG